MGAARTRAPARLRCATALLAALGSLAAVVGCDRRAPSSPREASAAREGASEAAPRGDTGTVEGWVQLAPGTALPRLPPPAERFPDGCPPYVGEVDGLSARLVGDRRLTDVLVNVTDYTRGVPERPEVRRVAIDRCRLTPALLSSSRGDTLEIVNRSGRPFFPTLEGGAFSQALLDGQGQTIPLARGGVRRLQCGLGEPCGLTFVVTLYHPLHTTTDGEGHFRIEGVPAGEPVTVSAFHPLFRAPAVAEVTLGAGETARLELVLSGAPEAPAGQEAGAPAGAPDAPPADVRPAPAAAAPR